MTLLSRIRNFKACSSIVFGIETSEIKNIQFYTLDQDQYTFYPAHDTFYIFIDSKNMISGQHMVPENFQRQIKIVDIKRESKGETFWSF